MMSSSFSSSAAFQPDHLAPLRTEQLCYVHCNYCDNILAVDVPGGSMFKTVTVRCGNCTNLLPVDLRGLLLRPAAPPAGQLSSGNSLLSRTSSPHSSCGSNLPGVPMPAAKPAPPEPEPTTSASSVNMRKDLGPRKRKKQCLELA
ncbi:hypothetical protein ACP70R_006858 [Stipagrostis hirtigluma subsp. patula]